MFAAEPQFVASMRGGGPMLGPHAHGHGVPPLPPYAPSNFSCGSSASGMQEEILPPFAQYGPPHLPPMHQHPPLHIQQQLEQQQHQQQQQLQENGHYSPPHPLYAIPSMSSDLRANCFGGGAFQHQAAAAHAPPGPFSCSPSYGLPPQGMEGASPPPHPAHCVAAAAVDNSANLASLHSSPGSPPSLSPGQCTRGNSRFSSPERPGTASSTSSSASSMPFLPGSPATTISSSSGGGAGGVASGAGTCSSASTNCSPVLARCASPSPRLGSSPNRALTPGPHGVKMPELLPDLEDHWYYSMLHHAPEKQVIVLTSRIKEKVPALAKTRWLDLQLSLRQCPYPIEHIEFTHAGDAVVQFISESAMNKALDRPPLLWGSAQQEIGTRPCTEEDITALFWVGLLGVPSELLPLARLALQPYGEVRGEYAPHPSMVDPSSSLLQSDLNGQAPEFVPGTSGGAAPAAGTASAACAAATSAAVAINAPPRPVGRSFSGSPPLPVPPSLSPPRGAPPLGSNTALGDALVPSNSMLKLYFAPIGRRRLPATIQITLPDRPKSLVARVFTPYGPLKPKCSDYAPTHPKFGCPECVRRTVHAQARTKTVDTAI